MYIRPINACGGEPSGGGWEHICRDSACLSSFFFRVPADAGDPGLANWCERNSSETFGLISGLLLLAANACMREVMRWRGLVLRHISVPQARWEALWICAGFPSLPSRLPLLLYRDAFRSVSFTETYWLSHQQLYPPPVEAARTGLKRSRGSLSTKSKYPIEAVDGTN
jgi:hypothetical protein